MAKMVDDPDLIDAINRWALHQHQRGDEPRYREVEVIGDLPSSLKNRIKFEIERRRVWPLPDSECGDEAQALVIVHARPGSREKFEYDVRVVEEFGGPRYGRADT